MYLEVHEQSTLLTHIHVHVGKYIHVHVYMVRYMYVYNGSAHAGCSTRIM